VFETWVYFRVKGEIVAVNPEYTVASHKAGTWMERCRSGNASLNWDGSGAVTAHTVDTFFIVLECVCLCVGIYL
jgi:hypothetical protein